MGLRTRPVRAGPKRQKTFAMEAVSTIASSAPDNSRDVNRRLVAMNPENAQTSTPARRLANLTPLPPRAEFVTQRRPHSPPSPDQTATRSSPDPTAARGVVSPSLHEELAQLRFDHTAADLCARTAEAEARAAEADARAALARKTAQQLDLETRDLASKSSHSQSDSPRSLTRSQHLGGWFDQRVPGLLE